MNSPSWKVREVTKCRDILEEKSLKQIQKYSIESYLKSLKGGD